MPACRSVAERPQLDKLQQTLSEMTAAPSAAVAEGRLGDACDSCKNIITEAAAIIQARGL